MTERHRQLGLLEDLRQQLSKLEDRAENCKAALQDASFKLHTYFDLDAGRIRTASNDLADAIEQGQDIRARIMQLEDALGL